MCVFFRPEVTSRRYVDRHLISHFVPFFPLERFHVEKCIKAEMMRVRRHPDPRFIALVMDELQFGGPGNNFSIKGCKNVAEKVNYVLSKDYGTQRQEL